MCGRYTLTVGPRTLAQRFNVLFKDEGTGRFNIAPGQEIATVTVGDDGRAGRLLRWGLIPSWAEEAKVGYRMINARSETVREKRTYAPLVETADHRCLIIADGFYEWFSPEDPKAARVPMHFGLEDGTPFAFAGLWTSWRSPAEGEILSCTILTTSANELVAPVHDRMPVILAGPEAEQAWLDAAVDGEAACRLLVPSQSAKMVGRPASRRVNSTSNDDSDCLVPDAEGVN